MGTNGEHGLKKIKFRLECLHHWWNFDTLEEAYSGEKELVKDCRASITKIEEFWDREGNLVDREKEKLQ